MCGTRDGGGFEATDNLGCVWIEWGVGSIRAGLVCGLAGASPWHGETMAIWEFRGVFDLTEQSCLSVGFGSEKLCVRFDGAKRDSLLVEHRFAIPAAPYRYVRFKFRKNWLFSDWRAGFLLFGRSLRVR